MIKRTMLSHNHAQLVGAQMMVMGVAKLAGVGVGSWGCVIDAVEQEHVQLFFCNLVDTENGYGYMNARAG